MSRGSTLVGAIAFFVSLNAFSQAIPQISVTEFKGLRDEAKDMIKNFELKKDIGDVGAPDYKFVRERMRSILDQKPVEFEKFLIAFNDTVADDYNLIQSVKDLGNTKAIKSTAKTAKKRFVTKAKSYQTHYQEALLEFVEKDLVNLEKQCLTVLCVNQVREDLKAWFKEAEKMNRPLKLDGVTLSKNSVIKSRLKQHVKDFSDPNLIRNKPIAYQRESEEYKKLTDPLIKASDLKYVSMDKILKQGVLEFKRETESCYESYKIEDYKLSIEANTKPKSTQNRHIEEKYAILSGTSLHFLNDGYYIPTYIYSEQPISAEPLVLRNKHFAFTAGRYEKGELVILNHKSGATLAKHKLKYSSHNPVVQAEDGTIAVGDDAGNLYFFDERGRLLSEIKFSKFPIRKEIKIDGNNYYVEDINGNKKTFERHNGIERNSLTEKASSLGVAPELKHQVIYDDAKISWKNAGNELVSQVSLAADHKTKPLVLENGLVVAGLKNGSLEFYNDSGLKVASQNLKAEILEVDENPDGTISVRTSRENLIVKAFHEDKKSREIIVKVPCTDEQIKNPNASKTISKGAVTK